MKSSIRQTLVSSVGTVRTSARVVTHAECSTASYADQVVEWFDVVAGKLGFVGC